MTGGKGRMIVAKREDDGQIFVLVLDDLSAWMFKASGLRLYLGLEKVHLNVLQGREDGNGKDLSDQPTAQ